VTGRTPLVALVFGAALVALAVSLSAAPRARAESDKKGPSQSYLYFPANGSNPAELLDTRTGALYKRNDSSSRWDLVVKPLEQE